MTTRRRWMNRVKPSRHQALVPALYEEANRLARMQQIDRARNAVLTLEAFLPSIAAPLLRLLADAEQPKSPDRQAPPVHDAPHTIFFMSRGEAARQRAIVSMRKAFKEGKYKKL